MGVFLNTLNILYNIYQQSKTTDEDELEALKQQQQKLKESNQELSEKFSDQAERKYAHLLKQKSDSEIRRLLENQNGLNSAARRCVLQEAAQRGIR